MNLRSMQQQSCWRQLKQPVLALSHSASRRMRCCLGAAAAPWPSFAGWVCGAFSGHDRVLACSAHVLGVLLGFLAGHGKLVGTAGAVRVACM